MNPKVDSILKKSKLWQEELNELRSIILECPLTEEVKWGEPCYTYNGKNVVLIHGFKEYCALLFMNGALIEDTHNILIQQTKNVQAGRQIRFTDLQTIKKQRKVLKAYILKAIEVEKQGKKFEYKKTEEFEMPEEFKKVLAANSKLDKAFNALTPGRQRGYLLFFAGAKQSKTREARIEKYIPKILSGKGLNDEG